jgi:hypothetical protein
MLLSDVQDLTGWKNGEILEVMEGPLGKDWDEERIDRIVQLDESDGTV